MLWVKYTDKEYTNSLSVMNDYLNSVIEGGENVTMLCEYHDVITKGTSTEAGDILSNNIPIYTTNRGGRATYHGKGQRVVYPIIDLRQAPWKKDIKKYIKFLERWLILCLDSFSLKCHAKDSIGIWHGEDKIGFIGIRVKKYCAYHGFSINISTCLEKFQHIKPCGFSSNKITSMKNLGIDISIEEFDEALKTAYYKLISEFI